MSAAVAKPPDLAGMVLLQGREFLMGAEDFYPDERPVRRASVGDFWIDATPVTNAQFAAFVAATGYVTFAEIAPDPRDYPGMPVSMAVAGSAVFVQPQARVPQADPGLWWRYVFGASWRHPLGPGSSIERIMDHPVVHIACSDAEAYARWAGKTLPSETEWEYAARGGLEGKSYAWGDELAPGGRMLANYWQGEFPWRNDLADGYERTSPVRSFPPNGFGLYDMTGNVWEWTADAYDAQRPARSCCGPRREPRAPDSAPAPRRVLKGGSHLCSLNYCRRYRPAARFPQPVDSPTSHIGFRCVVRV